MRLFKLLSGLSVIASFGLLFSTSVFAQANGSIPIDQIIYAEKVINYFHQNQVCSSTYIKTGLYLANCRATLKELTNNVVDWLAELKAGTLTVAYDTQVETKLRNLENALKTTLNDAGYTYDAAAAAADTLKDSRSPAYQISPDEISPEVNSVICVACGLAAGAGYYVCLASGLVPVVGAVCVLGIAAGYIACAYTDCIVPFGAPTPTQCTADASVTPQGEDSGRYAWIGVIPLTGNRSEMTPTSLCIQPYEPTAA